jgi:hypothetical protein
MSKFQRGDYVIYNGKSTRIISKQLQYTTLYLILESSHPYSFRLSKFIADQYNICFDAEISSNDFDKDVLQIDESQLFYDYSCSGGKSVPFHDSVKIPLADSGVHEEDRGGLKYL